MKHATSIVLCLAALIAGPALAAGKVTVYKSPSCGCCGKWVEHMQANGFDTEPRNMHDLRMIKSMNGIAPSQQSCHTAIVDGYVVEGHVPAADVKRLLAERPDIRGIAVPGMPMGSPGMEGPRKDAYQVITLPRQGASEVFAHH